MPERGAVVTERPPGTVSWRELQAEAADRLRAAGNPNAAMDARRLVEGVTDTAGSEYYEVLDELATVRMLAHFDAMVARRAGGEPLQYVLGRWAFRRLDLMVDRRVLIPRPETESVVTVALAEIDRLVDAYGTTYDNRLVVADLGTGSGAIALAIASECPLVDVWATDVSPTALQVARANLAGIGRAASRVRIAQGSWFEALSSELQGRFGVIVSNPPYVGPDEWLPQEVAAWEPESALRAAENGLADLLAILAEAPVWLVPGGALVMECDPRQVSVLERAAGDAGFANTAVLQDLAGSDRAFVARRGERG